MYNIVSFPRALLRYGWVLCTCFLLSCNTGENTTWKKDSIAKIYRPKGWEGLLKNGLKDWHVFGGDAPGPAWSIEDSVLHLKASLAIDGSNHERDDLVSDKVYENFDLQLDWKIAEGGSSGILFYVSEDTVLYKNARNSGLEMQITDNDKTEAGKKLKQRTGDLFGLISSDATNAVYPAGQWNHTEIICNKGKLDFYLNYEHILSVWLWDENWKSLIKISGFSAIAGYGSFTKGKIALQNEGSEVWFKNVKIKKL